MNPMNDKPWKHRCSNGTVFTCKRCDFTEPIVVEPGDANIPQLMCDVAEMIGFHATNIHPNLNGFSGYDCIKFEMSWDKEEDDDG